MERKITIECANPRHRQMKGIYRINYGHKFYIGRADLFAHRMYSHQCNLNTWLSRYAMLPSEKTYLYELLQFLHENPDLTKAAANLIQRGITFSDVHYMENGWLSEYEGHADCLNSTFYSVFPSSAKNKDHRQDCWMLNGVIYYYDPLLWELAEPKSEHLTANGFPRKKPLPAQELATSG